MTIILSLIVAVLFGLWGYKKGLFAVWAFAFNVIMAVYLGVMLTPTILDAAGGHLKPLGPSANVLVVFLVTIIYFIIAHLICKMYFTGTFCVSFPRLVDIIGGSILAFAAGLLIANFILFSIAISPLRDISYISKYMPAGMENSSRGHIINACQFVSSCSLQYGDKNIPTAVEIVSRSACRKASIPVEQKAGPIESGRITTVPRQPQKTITELNE